MPRTNRTRASSAGGRQSTEARQTIGSSGPSRKCIHDAARAKMRPADEYDSAQGRGEVASRGGERSGREHSAAVPPAANLGLCRDQIKGLV